MLLEAQRLSKVYKRGSRSFPAVDDVNLSVGTGDFICITGRSGSGKSTLLNMLVGLLAPTSGSVIFDGREFSKLSDSELSYSRNTQIGYIPQGRSILSNLTVLDNVRLPFFLSKREGDATRRALLLLEEVGLLSLAEIYPSELSGGELRRVSIARALINKPRLIIADEPTGDLDTQTTKEILQLFSRISGNGTSVLLVTHDLEAIDYGNRRYIMDSGRLMKENSFSKL